MTSDFRSHFLEEAVALFRKQKSLGERAMAQLDDAQFFITLDQESNSVAIIVKHLRGNMRSRWTGFLTTDGEKPDRQRDEEFLQSDEQTRAQVMAWWEEGWTALFEALGELSPSDVEATVHIRAQPMSVTTAILRQLDHYGQHVGQIVFLAKHLRGTEWKTLSIPRGKSEEFKVERPKL
jgi:hypothetical protein